MQNIKAHGNKFLVEMKNDKGEYATFISDVKKDTATDGYNCIVAPNCTELPLPSNLFLRFARKVDLVQKY